MDNVANFKIHAELKRLGDCVEYLSRRVTTLEEDIAEQKESDAQGADAFERLRVELASQLGRLDPAVEGKTV